MLNTQSSNKKAWMNNTVFKEWLTDVNSSMRRQGRKILLMLDNATSHGKESDYELSNICVKFLPANTTSHLQPLDQGIIRTFKAHYRRHLLKALISTMDSSENVTELCKNVTLLDAIRWIVKAWGDVKPTTIVKCFSTVGFCDGEISAVMSDDIDEDDDIPLAVLLREFQCSREDFEQIDMDLPTEDDSDEWERNLLNSFVSKESPELPDEETESESNASEEAQPGSEMNHQEALQLLIRLKNFALEKDCDMLPKLEDLQSLVETKIVKSKCNLTQSKLDKFCLVEN